MSLSTPTLKFLLDENVRIELFRHISKNSDVKLAPKSTPDSKIAGLSKKEKRIMVTNDEDFTDYSIDKIFSVIWLRIPQSNPQTLISAFDKLIAEFSNFEGRLIVLEPNSWEDFPLLED